MKKVILILFVLVNFSCRVHNYNDDMRKCINKNYIILKKNSGVSKSEIPILNNNFDIFKYIKQFETLLIDTNVLKNRSKKSYKKLIQNEINKIDKKIIIDSTKLHNPFMRSLHDNSAPYKLVFYSSCPYNTVFKKKGGKTYYPTKAVFEKLIQNGFYPTKKLLIELLEVTDFNDETSRLILCNLIFDNWYDWKGDIRTNNDVNNSFTS